MWIIHTTFLLCYRVKYGAAVGPRGAATFLPWASPNKGLSLPHAQANDVLHFLPEVLIGFQFYQNTIINFNYSFYSESYGLIFGRLVERVLNIFDVKVGFKKLDQRHKRWETKTLLRAVCYQIFTFKKGNFNKTGSSYVYSSTYRYTSCF